MKKDALRFRNLSGAIVTWILDPPYEHLGQRIAPRGGTWSCDGCGTSDFSGSYEAERHASKCRAF